MNTPGNLEGRLRAEYYNHNGLGYLNVGPYTVTRREIAVGVTLGALLVGGITGAALVSRSADVEHERVMAQVATVNPEADRIVVDTTSKSVNIIFDKGNIIQLCEANYSVEGFRAVILADLICSDYVKAP